MNKKRLSSALLAIAVAGPACAADLPRRVQPPSFTPVPVFTWTGFSVGGNVGYAFTTRESRNRNAAFLIDDRAIGTVGGTFGFSNRGQNGFTGGLQVGANYQMTPGSGVVVGVEADAQYLDAGRRRSGVLAGPNTVLNPNAIFFDPRATAGLEYFGTARGRLGYAFDRTLVYATGGFAYGGGSARRFFGATDNAQMRTGWTVGGGVEYALGRDSFLNVFGASAVTLKLEGLYVNLARNGGASLLAVNTGTGDVFLRTPGRRALGDDFMVLRSGLNYTFSTN
ncbi:outer membrane protein [Methylobacterium sp. WSM2598]|uniref:outer membrane protein n=1 Tax=Methylobacterium sp. WSM2598 TaxID=398261 RepID=UPI0003A6182F|nr:outer membrane beta-barrel protein [Methylobacterium sp. WSM2598]